MKIFYILKKVGKKSTKIIFYLTLYIIDVRWGEIKSYLNLPQPASCFKKFIELVLKLFISIPNPYH